MKTNGQTDKFVTQGRWARLVRSTAWLCLGFSVACGAAGVQENADRYLTTPTAWVWYTNATEATINTRIDQGYRPVDIEVVGISPYRFSVSMVKNQGDYHRNGFWWYFGKSSQQIKDLLSDNKARIVDLEVYWVGDQKRYAAIMVDNTGANRLGWWYYSQLNYSSLKDKLEVNGARLIDLDTYERNGDRYFSAVMIENSGAQSKGWWWYTNLTLDDVKDKLSQNNARLVDIERRSEGRYAVVMEEAQGRHWAWYVGLSYDDLQRQIGNWGARIADIEKYQEDGQTRYAVVLLNSSNAAETRVGNYIRANLEDGGSYGFYLRRRGGSVLASRRSTTSVYPASTIKVLQHVYAMHEVDEGRARLSDFVRVYDNSSESCQNTHQGHTVTNRSLSVVLRRMMENSVNQDTNAVQEHFGGGSAALGRQRIMEFVQAAAGISDGTRLVHKLGCGGANNDPSNLMTVMDMAALYDAVAAGVLFSNATRDNFYDLMSQNRFFDRVIDEEAPPGVNVAAFKRGVVVAYKSGSVSNHDSTAGWVRLPVQGGSREYVFGIYVERGDAVGPTGAVAEMLRGEIRAALEAF